MAKKSKRNSASRRKKPTASKSTGLNDISQNESDAPLSGQSNVTRSYQASVPETVKTPSGNGTLFESATSSPILFVFLVLLIATPAVLGPYGQKGGYSPDLHMAAYIQVFAFLLLTAMLFSPHFSKRIEIPKAPTVLPFALLFLWAMLSVLWADTLFEAMTDALDWVGAFVTGFMVLLLVRNINSVHRIIEGVAISGLLLSLLGVGQYLFGLDWVQQHIVPATTFSNKNMAGQFAVLTLPLMIGMFLTSKDVVRIWGYAIAIALTGAFLFYSRARGAWVSTIVMLGLLTLFMVYMVWLRKYRLLGMQKKIAAAMIIPIFLGLGYLTPGLLGTADLVKTKSLGSPNQSIYEKKSGLDVLQHVTSKGQIGSTADVRFTMWLNSIPMFLDHPWLGVGLGNWTVHYAAYQSWFKQDKKYMVNEYHANAHNDYVELICELGAVGLILMLWCLIGLFRVLKTLLFTRDTYDPFNTILSFSLVLALLSIATNAVFSFPLKQPVPIMLVISYIALLSCLYSIKFSQARYTLEWSNRIYISVIGGVAAVVTALVIFLQYHWFQSEVYYRNALAISKGSSGQRNKQQAILKTARLAYEHMPSRNRLLWMEGTAFLRLGNPKKAVSLYKRVLESYPHQENSLSNIAAANISLNNPQEALYYYSRLVRAQTSYNYNGVIRYIDLLMRNGWYKQALAEVNRQYDYYNDAYEKRLETIVDHRSKVGKTNTIDNHFLDQKKARAERFALFRKEIIKYKAAVDVKRKQAKAQQSKPVPVVVSPSKSPKQ